MSEERPLLRVIRGAPTPEELAALVVAITTKQQAASTAAEQKSAWRDRASLLRRPTSAGAGAWQAAARAAGTRTRAAW